MDWHRYGSYLRMQEVQRVIRVEPIRVASVKNLLSEPDEANEGTQRAGDHKAALKTVCDEVLSAMIVTEF